MKTAKPDQIKLFLIMISIFLVASVNTEVNANESPVIDLDKSTVLITGSNRGIGLSLAENYAEQGWNVVATCRKPDKATDLISLKEKYDNVNIEQLDVTSQKQINALAEKYKGIPIDVLLNNAGILGDIKDQVFGALNEETFEQVFAVNTLAPLKVSEAFVEHVSLSEQKKIVSMTSGLGSMQITANQSYFYFYRMSKAALNMAVVAMNASLRNQGIISALIAPGQVDTKLLEESGYRGPNKITPDESAKSLIRIIDSLSQETINKNGNKAINVDDRVLPW
ncbi:MAG: SDR family oxidoreductase [Gammaproteobacteria bacterium]